VAVPREPSSPWRQCKSDTPRRLIYRSSRSPACICGVSPCVTTIQPGQSMQRRLFHLTVVISFLLCITTAVLWARSYWRSDAIVYMGSSGHRAIQWFNGLLAVGTDNIGTRQRHLRIDSWYIHGESISSIGHGWWARRGFATETNANPASAIPLKNRLPDELAYPAIVTAKRATVPLWVPLILFGILPAHASRSPIRRWWRRRSGCCETCGYDLRVSGERCPECGTAVKPTASTEG
jgi:hypothetical protein